MSQDSRSTRLDRWRLIELTYQAGPTQLAISEAVLNAVARGSAPPTLRFYSWSEPVVILGVGQPSTDLNLRACEAHEYRVLRRISGGTAVYHDEHELSFEITVPTGHSLAPSDVNVAYARFSEILASALARLGLVTQMVEVVERTTRTVDPLLAPACFAALSPFELLASGRKLVGLAQVRRRGATIQHGAIYQRWDATMLAHALSAPTSDLTESRRATLADQVTDLQTVTGRSIELWEVSRAIHEAMVDALGVPIAVGNLSPAEEAEAVQLAENKYLRPEWTFRR